MATGVMPSLQRRCVRRRTQWGRARTRWCRRRGTRQTLVHARAHAPCLLEPPREPLWVVIRVQPVPRQPICIPSMELPMLLSVPCVRNPFAQVTASRRMNAVMCSRALRADGWSTVCIVSPCWGALSNFLLGNGDDILLRRLKTAAARLFANVPH